MYESVDSDLTQGFLFVFSINIYNLYDDINFCYNKHHGHPQGPSNFATREIAKNLRTQENCEEHVFKSN